MSATTDTISKPKGGWWALSPLAVFLCLYLVTSLLVNDFYKVPITVAFLASSCYAIAITRGLNLEQRIYQFSVGASNKNIMLMVWIFILAGAFAQSAKQMGAIDATVNLTLHILPDNLLLAGIFIAACFISLSIGTSVGTIVALTPVAVGLAEATNVNTGMMTAIVVGGAFFGDNLSFISDTTIAACNGQGCEMKDKFRENFWIALPAALATLALILVISFRQAPGTPIVHEYHLLQMVPYLLVLIGGIAGIQVFVVLLIGIASGAVIMLGTGQTTLLDMLSSMGSGTSGMFETCMVAILVAAMCALIRENGGFTVLLRAIHKIFRGKKGGQLGVGILVALLDIATANNTVAIVMANPIAKQMSEDYGITPRKTASLLDTFSCISQGILPYGAQMLVAISAVHELGYELSAFEIMANLFYPGMLLVSSLIFIFVLPDRKNAESNA